jgi:hypothetical protein
MRPHLLGVAPEPLGKLATMPKRLSRMGRPWGPSLVRRSLMVHRSYVIMPWAFFYEPKSLGPCMWQGSGHGVGRLQVPVGQYRQFLGLFGRFPGATRLFTRKTRGPAAVRTRSRAGVPVVPRCLGIGC